MEINGELAMLAYADDIVVMSVNINNKNNMYQKIAKRITSGNR